MCYIEHSTWIKEIIDKAIIPILVGAISYVLFRGLDERKKRKTYSTLGAIIIDSLIEEVSTGIDIINGTLQRNAQFSRQNLPSKSWSGINTFSDEVLLRIIRVSNGVQPNGSFHPKDIRKHTKNYFDHMCFNWNNLANP